MTSLIIGLGNPGLQYAKNRHNVGFMAIDQIAKQYHFPDFSHKFRGQFATNNIHGQKVILLKPETYMNLSGKSVLECAHFFKILPDKIFVIHDELDLEVGRIKVKFAGSHAGHNGLKSIDSLITPNYQRIRFGISRPEFADVSNYVLSNFNDSDYHLVNPMLDAIAKNINLILTGESVKFMNNCALVFNGLLQQGE